MSEHRTLFPDGAYDQPMSLMLRALAMLGGDVAEWKQFAQQVREMRHAQATARFGVPHSRKKMERLERAVDNLLNELADLVATPALDFTRPAKGGAQ